MNISAFDRSAAAVAVDVHFTNDALVVQLSDGREISVPLDWYPLLRDATVEQLSHWRLIGRGVGIHWDDLDEDLSVAGILRA